MRPAVFVEPWRERIQELLDAGLYDGKVELEIATVALSTQGEDMPHVIQMLEKLDTLSAKARSKNNEYYMCPPPLPSPTPTPLIR